MSEWQLNVWLHAVKASQDCTIAVEAISSQCVIITAALSFSVYSFL